MAVYRDMQTLAHVVHHRSRPVVLYRSLCIDLSVVMKGSTMLQAVELSACPDYAGLCSTTEISFKQPFVRVQGIHMTCACTGAGGSRWQHSRTAGDRHCPAPQEEGCQQPNQSRRCSCHCRNGTETMPGNVLTWNGMAVNKQQMSRCRLKIA